MKFKVDENLPLEVMELLRSFGHDAMTAIEQQLNGRSDSELAAACQRESRCLVTLDLDFSDIRTYPPQLYAGIIVLRPTVQSIASIASITSRVLTLLASEPVTGRLWVADETRVRIRDIEAEP
jgi:predicted nuclease of predicted toxin-antitoxin system